MTDLGTVPVTKLAELLRELTYQMKHVRNIILLITKIKMLKHKRYAGFRYSGPITNLAELLNRGNEATNILDEACKEHNIDYHKNKDVKTLHKHDKILENDV